MQVQQDQGYEVLKCTKINLFEIEVKYCKEISCQKIRVTMVTNKVLAEWQTLQSFMNQIL